MAYYYKYHYVVHLEKKAKFLEDTLKKIQTMEPTLDESVSKIKATEKVNEIIKSHEQLKDKEFELELTDSYAPSEERKKTIKSEIEEIKAFEAGNQVGDLFLDLPDFLGGDLDTTNDVRLFYRATIRRLLSGSIGRTADVLHKIMRNQIKTMKDAAEEINANESGTLDTDVNKNWLRGRLIDVNISKSKRIFNACLAPKRNSTSNFEPFFYSTRTNFYNIDHLIADSKADKNKPGYDEVQSIVNFAPLESEKNNAANALDCFGRLDPTRQIYTSIAQIHPYCEWLLDTHFKKHENDKSGKSLIHQNIFDMNSGDEVRVECYDWSKKMFNKNNLEDQLVVTILSEEFSYFMAIEAYK